MTEDDWSLKEKVCISYKDSLKLQHCIRDSHRILNNLERECRDVLSLYDINELKKRHQELDDLNNNLEKAIDKRLKKYIGVE